MAAKKSQASKPSAVSKVVSSTPVRNSAVPPKSIAAAVSKKMAAPSYDDIALRAYFISQSGTGSSEDENWFRAERELRAGV